MPGLRITIFYALGSRDNIHAARPEVGRASRVAPSPRSGGALFMALENAGA
jgi:hypothetical protein